MTHSWTKYTFPHFRRIAYGIALTDKQKIETEKNLATMLKTMGIFRGSQNSAPAKLSKWTKSGG